MHQGGTRSGKTYGICQYLIIWSLRHAGEGVKCTIARHYKSNHKEGAAYTLREALDNTKIETEDGTLHPIPYSMNNQTYETELWGNRIVFIGTDTPVKLQGPERDLLWLNEANEVSKAAWDELSSRTKGVTILDYNPNFYQGHWLWKVIDDPQKYGFKTCDVFKTTYKDNYWVKESQKRLYESWKETDPYRYQTMTLGRRARPANAVYPKWEEADEYPKNVDKEAYGLDFGFSGSKNALVKVGWKGDQIFVEELLYRRGMTVADLIDWMDKNEIDTYTPIYADHEPEQIEQIYRAGYNIHKATKSVQAGINRVKEHHINVIGTNIVNEINGYRWQQDKNKNLLEKPVDEDDHLMDAMRYAVMTHLADAYQPTRGFSEVF